MSTPGASSNWNFGLSGSSSAALASRLNKSFRPSNDKELSAYLALIKPPSTWERLDVSAEERTDWLTELEDVTSTLRIGPICQVPTQGNGATEAAPTKVGNTEIANLGYSHYVSFLDDLEEKVATKRIKDYALWLYGPPSTEITQLPSDMIRHGMDENATGNMKLVNEHRRQLQEMDVKLADLLKARMSKDAIRRYNVQKKDFTFTMEGNDTEKFQSGLALISIMLDDMNPTTKVNTAHLHEDLKKTTLKDYNGNVIKYLAAVEAKVLRIKSEKKNGHYDNDDNEARVFEQLLTHPAPKWQNMMLRYQTDWQLGDMTFKEAVGKAKIVYTNLSSTSEWTKLSDDQQKIIMLTTELKELKSQSKKTSHTDTNPKTEPTTKPTTFATMPEWQRKYQGDTIIHEGKKKVWCPHHKNDAAGLDGCYMPEDHDHEVWAANKKAKREALAAKREAYKTKRQHREEDENTNPAPKALSDNAKKARLEIGKHFSTMLTTQFHVPGSEANDLVQGLLDRHEADINESSG